MPESSQQDLILRAARDPTVHKRDTRVPHKNVKPTSVARESNETSKSGDMGITAEDSLRERTMGRVFKGPTTRR